MKMNNFQSYQCDNTHNEFNEGRILRGVCNIRIFLCGV